MLKFKPINSIEDRADGRLGIIHSKIMRMDWGNTQLAYGQGDIVHVAICRALPLWDTTPNFKYQYFIVNELRNIQHTSGNAFNLNRY